jgi:Ca-activated chloride channel family protein
MKILLEPIRSAVSAEPGDFHVLVRLQGTPNAHVARTPLNVALVIDRSGSMGDGKLDEAKRCAYDFFCRMSGEDRVAVVVYDHHVRTLLPLTTVDAARMQIKQLLEQVKTGGYTALHEGWLRGAELLAPHAGRTAVNHVVLLTDGQANRGLTDVSEICAQVGALAAAGVTTTTVGLGADFNEELLTAMATAGRGRAHYGERAVDLAETFESEIGLLSHLQWRDVRVSLRGAAQHTSQVQLMNPYPRQGDAWMVPPIAAGAESWAMLRLPMALIAQPTLSVCVTATDADGVSRTFEASLDALPVVPPTVWTQMPANELVARRLLELRAAEMQMQIRDAVNRHLWDHAERLLRDLEYLGRDEPWVAASIGHLRRLVEMRDDIRLSKEMMYKSMRMTTRSTSTREGMFVASDQMNEPAYLRRKMVEGRRSDGQ